MNAQEKAIRTLVHRGEIFLYSIRLYGRDGLTTKEYAFFSEFPLYAGDRVLVTTSVGMAAGQVSERLLELPPGYPEGLKLQRVVASVPAYAAGLDKVAATTKLLQEAEIAARNQRAAEQAADLGV